MEKENKEKLIYIPLKEATKLCNYSQEYLSLRARQGKLKSAKFGRNWITTQEWLEEYINKSEEYNSAHKGNAYWIKNKKERKIVITNIAPQPIKTQKFKKILIIKVPKNLPIEKEPTSRYGFAAFTAALVLVSFLAVVIFGSQIFFTGSSKNIYLLAQEKIFGIDSLKTNIDSKYFTGDLQIKFKEYLKLLSESIKLLFADFKNLLRINR